MTTPIQSPPQELVHEGYIKRINELTLEANTDLLDIEANYENDIKATELKNFKASLYNIECETSAAYTDLCTWKASNTRPSDQTKAIGLISTLAATLIPT